jgi:hypothetical protein
MDRPEVHEPRFHYLGALCQLAAGNRAGLEAACARAGADTTLRPECEYVLGWSDLDRQDATAAAVHFERVAASNSPSAPVARALLGGLKFFQGDYNQAVIKWRGLDAAARERWKLQQPLAGIVFVSALQAFGEGDYQAAAARVREAGRLGIKDRRLAPLLALALLKAGQKLLYQTAQ